MAGETKEGQISRGVATRKGGKLWSDGSVILQDMPEYLESSVQYQLPFYVSQIAVRITSFSFSMFKQIAIIVKATSNYNHILFYRLLYLYHMK